MSAAGPRTIPNAVTDRQHAASDPAASAWVSANAGAGKTYVLAQRVIRLLLDGTPPSKMLCLTYTKAAAANMANRVFERLGRWATLDDDRLDAEIRAAGVRRIDGTLRARARRLFADALETPGGLKVQTIHAFCTRLLQQFPFEANVAARFQVLEETQQSQMLERLRMDVLLTASANLDSPTGRALASIIPLASDFMFQLALPEAIREHRRVTEWLDHARGIDGAMAELSQSLGVEATDTPETIEREIFESPHLPISEWLAAIATLQQGSKNDREQAARLAAAQASSGPERLAALVSVFCTDSGSPRKELATKGIQARYPDLHQQLTTEQRRLCALLDRRRAVINRTRTGALLTIAAAVIERYRADKAARGVLDYDDLIAKTRDMLNRVSAAWVHYKLDLGIDHLLIDEAQDTSPEQWDIVERLTAEFAAGAGARGAIRRSIFAVGDDKQSIYSFQGADPRQFHRKQLSFRAEFQAAGMPWRDVRLDYSFRSNDSVLGAVEQVFQADALFRSVTSDEGGMPRHLALDDAAPGFVELWPIVKQDDRAQTLGWDAPFDKTTESSPRVKLARQIAKTVRHWIERRDRVGTGVDRHDVRPGDILVLVRQRGPLFEAIIRTLKDENVAVAGADRLALADHIAVMDLLTLADALLLPDDDLALATVLKSPLFGVTEDELLALAWNRRGTLRAALAGRHPALSAQLDDLAREAQRRSPFAFYSALLGAQHGRRRFVARLGLEANDVLDEFLNLALTYETHETPSLHGFIAWLRTASAQIKRDMELARDEVRVMTVHGAKGLEAPIVILTDTTTPPEGPMQHQPRLLSLPAERAPPETPDRLVWMPNKSDDTPPIAKARALARDKAEDEYRRLLYVAMTRAADRLVICGSEGIRKRPPGCWYNLIAKALEPLCTEEPADVGDGTVKRYRKDREPEEQLSLPGATGPDVPPEVPTWLTRPAQFQVAAPAPLAPSQAHDETTPAPRIGADARRLALARGVVMHRLLQSLPAVEPARRAEAAKRFLSTRSHELAGEDLAALARKALQIVEHPRFCRLFLPGSLAEVPIVGTVDIGGQRRAVTGIIDRLSVTGEAVLIADYKTNRDAPQTPADVPKAYLQQLALYRALLAELYRGRPVQTALIWTEVPDLMELSSPDLDAALADLDSAQP